MAAFRKEKDSLGEVRVPKEAMYGAQTQRAIENFPISGIPFNRSFIGAIGLLKQIAAKVNGELGQIQKNVSTAIQKAAKEVNRGLWDDDFPVDIFQTGSGTSTNMNANEVIARRANQLLKGRKQIHPNDDVNCGQSSNDVIPTVTRIAAFLSVQWSLIPALQTLSGAFNKKGDEYSDVIKTGRTHLMDALPVSFKQVLGGYARQLDLSVDRLTNALHRTRELPIGGTAVGTGVNTHAQFAKRFVKALCAETKAPFIEAVDHFESQGAVDAQVELSAVLKTVGVSLYKIANDIRWMNSGPNNGLGEVQLKALQPGSSIMPGKVNPVIEESVCMVCAQVIGYDAAINMAGISGNFELNVMQPLIAHNLLESIRLLSNASLNMAERSISNLKVNADAIKERLDRNPILVTTLNPVVGYETAAIIAKEAFQSGQPVIEVAMKHCNLSERELKKILDPVRMIKGGIIK